MTDDKNRENRPSITYPDAGYVHIEKNQFMSFDNETIGKTMLAGLRAMPESEQERMAGTGPFR